jgi:hypothetical protein
MRNIGKRVSGVALAMAVCASLAFGASEALASASVTRASNAICPTTLPWNGECGFACNKSCVSKGYPEGGCMNYTPTKKCCRCLF